MSDTMSDNVSFDPPERVKATYHALFRRYDNGRRGLLTPSGKPKKLPWWVITHCPSCKSWGHTGIKVPVAKRWRCQNYLWRRSVGIHPCDTIVDIVEAHGIDIERAFDSRTQWKEKYL